MRKWHYTILIFFSALTALSGLLQSTIRFLVGPQMLTLEPFSDWLLVTNIITFIGSTLILKYFYHQRYRLALAAGIVSVTSTFLYAMVIFIILEFQKPGNLNLPMLILSLSANVVYAACLLSLKTKSNYWLRLAGVYMLAIGLFLLITVIRSLTTNSFRYNFNLEKIAEWISLANSLVPVFFIIHFLKEHRKLTTRPSPIHNLSKNVWYSTGAISLLVMLISGIMLSSECYSSLYWANKNFERTKELAQRSEFRTFVNSKGETLLYRLIKPLHYDPSKNYPLVVSLPYGGQPPTDTLRQIEGAAAAELLSIDSNRRKYPAFIFIPHCPPGSGWGGLPNYPSVDSLVFDAISSLDKQFGIDVNRRYVTGISRGGYGAWNFICRRPDLFAAAIPVCGGGDPALASNAATVAVWAFHGKKDKNVPVSSAQNMITALEKAGGHPIYSEFPDEGHNIWYKVTTTPGLWDWLFAQKRQ
ncbi:MULTISPECIES: carboxylesterase family protein [Niastella]|uniref:Peptidase S9 prolyl oligopeptidase catalytic domain-containing protein n=1 Tax=Niastella soli TaxID=2821487 RepID=A0ABS3Z234_9BACT|nr:hypothetical protein [Niastella soli]MBO9204232.1 hypothetical protein [Niastella soli]